METINNWRELHAKLYYKTDLPVGIDNPTKGPEINGRSNSSKTLWMIAGALLLVGVVTLFDWQSILARFKRDEISAND